MLKQSGSNKDIVKRNVRGATTYISNQISIRTIALLIAFLLVLDTVIIPIQVNISAPKSYAFSSQWSQNIYLGNDGTYRNVEPGESGKGVVLKANSVLFSKKGNGSWHRKARVKIDNFYPDYQVKLNISYDPEMKPDFSDLRFYDETANKDLAFWVESTANMSAAVWVRTGDNNNIYMYFNNPQAQSTSNLKSTFIMGDDFNENIIDSSWTKFETGGATGARTAENSQYLRIIQDPKNESAEFGIKKELRTEIDNFEVGVKFRSNLLGSEGEQYAGITYLDTGGNNISQRLSRETSYYKSLEIFNDPDGNIFTTSYNVNEYVVLNLALLNGNLNLLFNGKQVWNASSKISNLKTLKIFSNVSNNPSPNTFDVDYIYLRRREVLDSKAKLEPKVGTYFKQGTLVSQAINPRGVYLWEEISFKKEQSANNNLTVDILNAENNTVLAAGFTTNTNITKLAGLKNFKAIKLRANFVSDSYNSPMLKEWLVKYKSDLSSPVISGDLEIISYKDNKVSLRLPAVVDTESKAAGYKIDRAVDLSGKPGGYKEVARAAGKVYIDKVPKAGKYWYRIRAYDNSSNDSAYSNEAGTPNRSVTKKPVITIPDAPANMPALALSTGTIRWRFSKGQERYLGLIVHDEKDNLLESFQDKKNTYFDETGLDANTKYSRHLHFNNRFGNSKASENISAYTLSTPPDIISGSQIKTWNNGNFVFKNAAGFGEGGVAYYRYTLNQNLKHSFNESENKWAIGELLLKPTENGYWYLHLKSYNGAGIANGVKTYGPFYYDDTMPTSPTNLKAEKNGSGIYLKWLSSYDTGSGLKYYIIERASDASGKLTQFKQIAPSFSNFYNDIDVLPNIKYAFRVRAIDESGNASGYVYSNK